MLLLVVASASWGERSATAADSRKVQQAINRGAAFLKGSLGRSGPGYHSIAGYAMLNAGLSPRDAQIPTIARLIQAKIQNGVYEPEQHHIYEAAVDLMVLEAADPQVYWDEIQAILNYLNANQHERGSWFYPDRPDGGGDSSISQYAILGLWAANRAGFEIPSSTWRRAAAWFIATQRPNGGHVYHPAAASGKSFYTQQTHSMTAAGASSLLIAELNLFGDNRNPSKRPQGKKFGVLERADAAASAQGDQFDDTNRKDIRTAADKAVGWLSDRYTVAPPRRGLYYLYGLERTAALAGIDQMAGHDWFDEGSTTIVNAQLADGSWIENGQPQETVAATSFALLFLTRATAKLLGREGPDSLDTGLMAGGRGLPNNLSAVEMNDGKVQTRKLAGGIDDLLLELENPKSLQVESAQAALVEAVQYGERTALVGQTERLKRLMADPRPEVRRTAVWALGRTADLSTARLLVEALNDSNVDVLVEARNALCWISRRPDGMGLPANPLEGLPKDADARQRQAAIEKWKKRAIARWQGWLLEVRPYNQRNDLMEAQSERR